jgi:hypothetical protein
MKVWGVPEEAIRAAVSEAGLTVWGDWRQDGSHRLDKEGNALHVRLCVDKTQPRTQDMELESENGLLPFQKRGRSFGGKLGRRTPYVTWEGHREFMRIVFRDYPEARIKSAIADYRGREDFDVKHPQTRGLWNSNEALNF